MKKKDATSATTSGIGRREFGQRAALVLTGAALAGTPLAGLSRDFAAVPISARPEQEQGESGLSPQAQAEVESKLQHIFATYGSRFSADQRKLMRRTVVSHVRMLEAVRPIKVANGDPPATVLKLLERRTRRASKTEASTDSSELSAVAKFSRRGN